MLYERVSDLSCKRETEAHFWPDGVQGSSLGRPPAILPGLCWPCPWMLRAAWAGSLFQGLVSWGWGQAGCYERTVLIFPLVSS